MDKVRVPASRQGQTGMGQGGFTCHEFADVIGEDVTVALRSKIPLETDLEILTRPDSWQLVDPIDPTTVINGSNSLGT